MSAVYPHIVCDRCHATYEWDWPSTPDGLRHEAAQEGWWSHPAQDWDLCGDCVMPDVIAEREGR